MRLLKTDLSVEKKKKLIPFQSGASPVMIKGVSFLPNATVSLQSDCERCFGAKKKKNRNHDLVVRCCCFLLSFFTVLVFFFSFFF